MVWVFFFRCSMELSDYHLIQDMLGKYREEAECVLIQAACVRHFIQARNQKWIRRFYPEFCLQMYECDKSNIKAVVGLEGNKFLCMSEMSRHVTSGVAAECVCWSSAGPGCVGCVSVNTRRQSGRRSQVLHSTSAVLHTPCLSLRISFHLDVSSAQLHTTFGAVVNYHLCPTLPFYSRSPTEQILSLVVNSSSQ